MVELEALAVVLLRWVGVGMMALSLLIGIGNVLQHWNTLHPSFIGQFVARQTNRTTILGGAGLVLVLLSEWLGSLLVSDLVG